MNRAHLMHMSVWIKGLPPSDTVVRGFEGRTASVIVRRRPWPELMLHPLVRSSDSFPSSVAGPGPGHGFSHRVRIPSLVAEKFPVVAPWLNSTLLAA
jgi:hypothetical protein